MKNGVTCLVSMFPSRIMVLKFSKKVLFFCNSVLTAARYLSLLKQFIYIYASERSRYVLSENVRHCLLYYDFLFQSY